MDNERANNPVCPVCGASENTAALPLPWRPILPPGEVFERFCFRCDKAGRMPYFNPEVQL